MIKKWVKILPYWIVVRFCRNFSGDYGKLVAGRELDVRYFQIDEGEFVVFSKEVQDAFNKRRDERRKEKNNKKLDKINKQLDKDYLLKEELKNQLKQEDEEDVQED